MYAEIEQKVDQLFADAVDPNSSFCMNPVTGEYFVPGYDPIRPIKKRTIRALVAQARFAAEKSPDMPDMPLNEREYSATWKWQSPQHYLVEAYTHSLRSRDFRLERHPDFETFARGVMALPSTPVEFRNDSDLLRRYPPKQLKGLKPGPIFESK